MILKIIQSSCEYSSCFLVTSSKWHCQKKESSNENNFYCRLVLDSKKILHVVFETCQYNIMEKWEKCQIIAYFHHFVMTDTWNYCYLTLYRIVPSGSIFNILFGAVTEWNFEFLEFSKYVSGNQILFSMELETDKRSLYWCCSLSSFQLWRKKKSIL